MATNKRRLNISLSPELDAVIARLAKRDRVPEATKAGELLRLALEIEEDIVLGKLASTREKNTKKFISHTAAWT